MYRNSTVGTRLHFPIDSMTSLSNCLNCCSHSLFTGLHSYGTKYIINGKTNKLLGLCGYQSANLKVGWMMAYLRKKLRQSNHLTTSGDVPYII